MGDKASDPNEILLWQTFRAGLRERGWNEGVNIRIEYRSVEGNAARLPEVAADLVRLKPDLIVTRGVPHPISWTPSRLARCPRNQVRYVRTQLGDRAGDVSWVDNSNGVAATRLERRLETFAFAAIADVPPGVTEYVDTSISAGTGYCYRVLAYTRDEVSPYSDEVCAIVSDQRYELELTVTSAGTGTGTVISAPSGILCGTDCSETYPTRTSVTLIAVPAMGSTFAGWSGPGCDGLEPCTLAGQGPVTVTATFIMNFFYVSAFPGSQPPGLELPGPCSRCARFFP